MGSSLQSHTLLADLRLSPLGPMKMKEIRRNTRNKRNLIWRKAVNTKNGKKGRKKGKRKEERTKKNRNIGPCSKPEWH